MLKNFLKNKFEDLIELHAKIAVEKAEEAFGNGNGEAKKTMAVTYIMQFIKLPPYLIFLKPFIGGALTKLIDKAVELAVDKLHDMQNKLLAG